MTIGLFPGELKPDATIAGCINIYENAWPNPLETIAAIEQECLKVDSGVSFHRANTIGQGPFQSARTNLDMGITYSARSSGNKLMKDVHNQFYFLLLAATLPYVEKYGIKEQLHHEHYNLLKYRPGEEYKAHYDGGSDIGRCVSAICYLNDDYEGGELEFPNFNVKIKPEKGMLLLFPSNYAYTHVAHPVTSGTKYALVTWLDDRQMSGNQ
jgi:predicted 2-oxoglutarate/Fe(II)-dependent dioxygenase YbiX